MEVNMEVPHNTKIRGMVPFDPAIPLHSMFPKKLKSPSYRAVVNNL